MPTNTTSIARRGLSNIAFAFCASQINKCNTTLKTFCKLLKRQQRKCEPPPDLPL